MLKVLVWIALGGSIGSVLRYIIAYFLHKQVGFEFPIETMVVNLSGSFLAGFIFSYIVEKLLIPPQIRAFILTGFLGGFTTFSTFAMESLNLLMEGRYGYFIFYFLFTNLGALFLSFLGYSLSRIL
ncbi:fluoride efflux transporter CrcB [Thermodesulfobacterium hveragerdense]|uniref:fluoride efflux transporter CrcB n=1 Tax=Thermodesulfobacterium hveragerdense TaxID=53424 RepID=UPI000429B8AA|nr:fluoride efflux transporter CrcB [Thermodesulfobacterium hveragerdense]